jgi:curved DNA-binding protein CbpA
MRKLFDSKARVVETENLFDVLGVPQTATRDEIKRAYFDAARRFHPDRLASMGLEALRPEVEKIFRRVSEAYGTLFDDARREQYVATLGDPNAAVDAGAKMMALLEAEGALRRGDMLLSKNDLAVEGSPEEGEHLGMLAWARLCARQIDLPAAQRLLQEALRQSPKCGRLHHYYGMTLKGDDSDRAAASFRRALELDKRLLASEQELRLMDMRAGRGPQKPAEPPPKKGGLFGRFRKG